jgi:type IV pilus assembly protein PilB
VANRHRVVPVNRAGSSLIVAMSDPANILAIDDLKFVTGYNIEVVVASEVAVTQALDRYYESKQAQLNLDEVMNELQDNVEYEAVAEDDVNALDLEKSAADAPVVKLCNHILLSAIQKGASDIHIEPYEKSYRVRYRVDGVLREEMQPPLKLKAGPLQPPQDHGPPGHRRAPAAPGRSHQAEDRRRQGDGLPCLRSSPRCSARRSSCVSSTRGTCSWT